MKRKRKRTRADLELRHSRVSAIVYEDGTRRDVTSDDPGSFMRTAVISEGVKTTGPLTDEAGKRIASVELTVSLEGLGFHARRAFVAGEGL